MPTSNGWTRVPEAAASNGWTPVQESPVESPQTSAPILSTATTAPKAQGLMSSGLESSGLSGLGSMALSMIEHPLTATKNLFGAFGVGDANQDNNPILKGLGSIIDTSAGNIKNAIHPRLGRSNDEVLGDIEKAIPLFGPSLSKAGDQINEGNTSGALGTGLGVAGALFAPKIFGAVGEAIPTRAKAGAIFDSLNSDLATTSVPLKSTIDPLQRATEIGARGSTLPKAVSDLLTRSQSPIEMTYPEARDYQSSLSDLSTSDKMALNSRMRGQVDQLHKGLFGDIYDAADTVGRGEDYAKAMQQYKTAARINNGLKTTAKIGATGIAGALGLGTLERYLKPLLP